MKKYKFLFVIIAFLGLIGMTSCGDDFLTTDSAGKVPAGGSATEDVILSNLASAYQILLFDSYADNNYNSVLLMSDLRSDDSYKGGESAGDQQQLYDLARFASTPTNIIGGLWTIYYSGMARCNNAILAADNAVEGSRPEVVNRYKAEALFLRAYYGHLLWKFWGNIPYFTEPLTEPYVSEQYTADVVYSKIMDDINAAEALNVLPMATRGGELGRVNKATLFMLKARVVMYQKDAGKYAEIANDMASIIKSGEYSLFGNFGALWDNENEFCSESIFESNQLPTGKTWASGWQGYGTNFPAYVSPNDLKDPNGIFKGGWGFAPLRSYLWESLFESGDTRREGSINNWRGENYNARFQDTGFFNRKYAARVGYNDLPGDQDLNYCNNLRIFRYAETLLNYAELVGVLNVPAQQGVSAQACLDEVRNRAFGSNASLPLNSDNIKLERRREFVGEGMRFWDLIRWGDAERVLTETVTESTPGTPNNPSVIWSWSRTFTAEKKHLPIPENDMNATKGTPFELKQNPGWN
ncbi:membrane protein [Bacteroidia bacterium]|nr:membrane protein [Bacteroidia bacterium]